METIRKIMHEKDYFLIFLSGVLSLGYKILKNSIRDHKALILEILFLSAVVLFITPAIIEYYKLSITTGCGLTWFVVQFSESFIKWVQSKLWNK
jgi:hypothetical protein